MTDPDHITRVELPTILDTPLPAETLTTPATKILGVNPQQQAGTVAGWGIGNTQLVAGTGSSQVGLSSEITAADDVRIWAGGSTPSSAPFRVTEAGQVVATNATITGSVSASSGTIGGWTINTSDLTGGNAQLSASGKLTLGSSNSVVIADASDANYRLWAGNATAASAPFSVSATGAIKANSGTIGGWTINTSDLTGSNAQLSASGKLTLGTGDDVVVTDAADATYRLYVGNATAASASFRVTKAGAVTASAITITGGSIAAAALPSKNGVASKAAADAATDTIAHGLGKVPTSVTIHATNSSNGLSRSEGHYTGSTTATIHVNSSGHTGVSDTSNIIKIEATGGGGVYKTATIAVDATNITLTWTGTGANTATVYSWNVI